MRAALVHELPTESFRLADVDDPQVEHEDDVIVRVEACGICGTDLHILAGRAYRPELPFVLGHEPVGEVLAAGDSSLVGARVTIGLFTGCGTCALCARGDERLCRQLRSITGVLGAWGGFAEQLLVHRGQLVPVPERLPTADAAVLVDAGPTAVNAVGVVTESSGAGTAVVVAGGGPVGLLSASLSRRAGHDVTLVEPNDARREAARSAGFATHSALDDVTGPVEAVIDCAGAAEVPRWALPALEPRGLFVAVGYGVVPELDTGDVVRKELTVRGVRSGSKAHLARALALAVEGQVALPPVTTWPLTRIDDAFAALRAGAVSGKAIIDVAGRGDSEGDPWTS